MSNEMSAELMQHTLNDLRKLLEETRQDAKAAREAAQVTHQELAVFRAEVTGEYRNIGIRIGALENEVKKLSRGHEKIVDEHIEELKDRVINLESDNKISKVKVGAFGSLGGGIAVAFKALFEWLASK